MTQSSSLNIVHLMFADVIDERERERETGEGKEVEPAFLLVLNAQATEHIAASSSHVTRTL